MEVENPQLPNLSQPNPLNTEYNQQNQTELNEEADSTDRTEINTNTEAKENGQAKMEILDSHNTLNSGKSPRIFVYGSCECDQFFIDGIKFITKKPIEISSYFTDIKKTVFSIACGELHTIFLLTNGDVYTSGCNDFHALGRSGDPCKPGKVELEFPIDMIAAGELHSVACNSVNSIVYHWGVYRNSQRRNVSTTKAPSLIGEEEFSGKKIKKVLSGLNHTMLLADGKVFLWGNLEDGVIGKHTSGRRNNKTRLNVAELNAPGVEDIFTGGQHCFLVQKKKKNSKKKEEEEETTLVAFGNNEFGQLGVKTRKKILNLTEAKEVKDLGIKDIKGGKNHTIILTNDGNVYGLGHNEKGELGTTLEVDDDKLKEYPDTMAFETNGHTRNNGLVSTAVPLKLELSNIQQIFSGPNYNYAIDAEQKIYSWGVGDNYLLGDRKEEIVFKAKQIDNDFLEGKPIYFGLGFQHVISMTVEEVPAHLRLNEEVFKAYEEADLAEKKKIILERMQTEEPVVEEEKKEEETTKAKPSTRGRGKAKEEAKMEEEDEKEDEEEEEVEETKKTRGKSKGTKKETAKKDEKKSTKSGSRKAKADEDEIEDEEEEEEKETKKTRGRSQGARKETGKDKKKATRRGSKKGKPEEDEMEEEEEEEKKEPKKTRGRSQTIKKVVNPKKGTKQEKSQSKDATKRSTGKQQKSVSKSTDKKKGKEKAPAITKKEPEVKANAQRNAKKRRIEMDGDDDGELKKVKRTTRSKSVTGKTRSKSGASKRK